MGGEKGREAPFSLSPHPQLWAARCTSTIQFWPHMPCCKPPLVPPVTLRIYSQLWNSLSRPLATGALGNLPCPTPDSPPMTTLCFNQI